MKNTATTIPYLSFQVSMSRNEWHRNVLAGNFRILARSAVWLVTGLPRTTRREILHYMRIVVEDSWFEIQQAMR